MMSGYNGCIANNSVNFLEAITRMSTTIYLIEDHFLLQRMLSEFIHHLPGLSMCGAATCGREALRQIPKVKPNIVLVDISLPDISGIEIVNELQAQYPNMVAVMLSSYREAYYVERAFAVGAHGYILKGDPLEIESAIQRVLQGEIYLSPPIAMN